MSNSSNYTKDVVVFFDGLYKERALEEFHEKMKGWLIPRESIKVEQIDEEKTYKIYAK